ncbi:hypothetical protein CDIK_2861 [Cucumispora dikerogammari]|nr:hypothetical protein CDIK_2861 [Cucumispora dikerogammari]
MVIRRELYEITKSVCGNFQFLVNFGLLKKNSFCKGCRKSMFLKPKNISDGLVWRCKSLKCNKKENSIRKNSVLFRLKISLKKIIEIIYEWSINSKIKDIKREVEVDYCTINSVFRLIRNKLKKEKFNKIGGKGCVVEIDETAVTKRKFEKGKTNATLWCVGGVCRIHKDFFFELTRVRNKPTLHNIVNKHVDKGSDIITDEWKAYNGLNKVFFVT